MRIASIHRKKKCDTLSLSETPKNHPLRLSLFSYLPLGPLRICSPTSLGPNTSSDVRTGFSEDLAKSWVKSSPYEDLIVLVGSKIKKSPKKQSAGSPANWCVSEVFHLNFLGGHRTHASELAKGYGEHVWSTRSCMLSNTPLPLTYKVTSSKTPKLFSKVSILSLVVFFMSFFLFVSDQTIPTKPQPGRPGPSPNALDLQARPKLLLGPNGLGSSGEEEGPGKGQPYLRYLFGLVTTPL